MRIVPLAPKYCIKKPPIAGPISLDVLKLTAVKATSDGTWVSSISLGAKDILIGWAAEAIIPINRQINSNDFIVSILVKIRKNNIEDFSSISSSGKIAMKLDQSDKIIGVKILLFSLSPRQQLLNRHKQTIFWYKLQHT